MILRLTAALVLLMCVGVVGILATINQFAIVDAVNAKLASDSQFNPIGWWFTKTRSLHTQYRRLYPKGGLLRRQGILTAAMLFCTTVAAGLIGIDIILVACLGVSGALLLWFIYFR